MKRGRGRLKKDVLLKIFVFKIKGDGKGSGDSLLESKLLICKVVLEKDWSELELGWFLRGRGVVLFVGGFVL